MVVLYHYGGIVGISVNITLDDAKVRELVRKTVIEGTEKAANITKKRVQENIVRADRINSGAMMNSIRASERLNTGVRCTWVVSTDVRYAMWQEQGIGPVFPVRAKALRFKPKGGSTFVFAKSTKGFPGAHFMRDAYRSIRVKDFT